MKRVLGHAVENGDLRYTSVSQLTRFDSSKYGGCERKWWYRYVQGILEPERASLKKGIEVHFQIEHYLRTGEDVLTSVPRSGKHLLPAPLPEKSGLLIEHQIDGELEAGGVPIIGQIDAVNFRGEYLDTEGILHDSPGVPEVLDWKTTSSRDYTPRPIDLATSTQMVGYASWLLGQGGDFPVIRLSHVYFKTRGVKESWKISTEASSEHIRKSWAVQDSVADRMRGVARETMETGVSVNLDACDAYGGCFYRLHCPRPVIIAGHQGENMSLLARLQGKNAGRQAGDLATEIAKLESEEAFMLTAKPSGTGVLPPDAPKSGGETLAAEPIPTDMLSTLTPVIQIAAQEVAPEGGRKRGRPKKTEEVCPVVVRNKLDLYVDVLIEGLHALSLDLYIQEVVEDLCTKNGVGDLRCASNDALGFGKWKGVLAAAVRASPPPSNAYVVREVRESEIKQVVVEALRPLAGVYVRGYA